MYQKKHLILTCIVTTLIVWGFACLYFTQILTPVFVDPISKAKQLILDQYVNELDEAQLTKLNDAAIGAMVYSLKDPYSMYLNPQALDEYTEEIREDYKGIGVKVNYVANENEMTIIRVYEDSPADKAGMLPGDIVKEIGEIVLSPENYEEALDYIKKGEDDDISITISRGGTKKQLVVHREEIIQQSTVSKMLDDGIGYINIEEFINSTAEDFAKAVSDLEAAGMQGLLIDLRGNPGGYANAVIEIADSLIPKGVIAYLENKEGKRQYFNSDEACLDLPMVVLIDGSSASASELLAGSLKAHDLATIVGEKSFGKAVGQSLYPMDGDTAIYLTDSRYFTPDGECIHGVGIVPDIEVQFPENLKGRMFLLSPQEDPQLSEGIRVLQEALNP